MQQKTDTTTHKPTFTVRRFEKIFILTLHIGVLLKILDMGPSGIIMIISTAGLTIAFFLSAFSHTYHNISEQKNDQQETLTLLNLVSLVIVPKALWIGSGISILATFIYLLKLETGGYTLLAGIGAGVLIVSLLVLGIGFMRGVKNLRSLAPLFIRVIPALIVNYFLIF